MRSRTVSAGALERAACMQDTKRSRANRAKADRTTTIERRVFTAGDLAAIGRSSLLVKALRVVESRRGASPGEVRP
ncbi:MAG: hypothetical protein ACKOCT_16790 [Alphaproteobacteria bacterium]